MELVILFAVLIGSMATVDLCPKSTYDDESVDKSVKL